MARISGIDLPRDKRIEIALTYVYGIGVDLAIGNHLNGFKTLLKLADARLGLCLLVLCLVIFAVF